MEELEYFTLKKLYQVPREISKRSFNEKDNKIYCENHDHSIIDCINDDCLAKIFMYVPVCERPKIALVCQKWNKILDFSWDNVKKFQLTHWEQPGNYPNCLKKYPTPDGRLSFLKLLLNKFGRYLTELDLSAYGYSDIVPVINEYCPNLLKLKLRFIDDNQKLSHDAFSCLSKLKVLEVIFQHMRNNFKLLDVIPALESLANTLTDLILCYWKNYLREKYDLPEDVTIDVLRRLKALKRLEIGNIRIFPKLADYLGSLRDNGKLKYCHYNIHPDNNLQFMTTLELRNYKISYNKMCNIHADNNHQFITTLDLRNYKISDNRVYTIANTMKRLTKFVVCCEELTNDAVVAISKMNRLTHLCFSGVNDSIDSSSIKLLKNLTKLMLPRSNKITDDLAMKVLENSPKMEVLFVLYSSVTVEFIKKAAKISENRKQPLLTAVSFIIDEKQYESPYFKII